jgi:hypothetical protein
MYTRLIYNLSGWLSVIVGLVCTVSIYQMRYVYYGVMLAILGFIFAGINIFLNQRFEFDEVKWPKGYIGMLLSSIPVLFLLFVILKFRR